MQHLGTASAETRKPSTPSSSLKATPHTTGQPQRATRCQIAGSAMNKAGRRKLHSAINGLSHEDVAAMVRSSFPGIRAGKVNQVAKGVIAGAHRAVSPRGQPRKTQRG
jgi:hypothetical protein